MISHSPASGLARFDAHFPQDVSITPRSVSSEASTSLAAGSVVAAPESLSVGQRLCAYGPPLKVTLWRPALMISYRRYDFAFEHGRVD